MDLISSLHELSNTAIAIYPNPAVELINIEIDGDFNFQATLYDIQGRPVSKSDNVKAIYLHSIPSGMYLMEIIDIDSGHKIVERIVIGK